MTKEVFVSNELTGAVRASYSSSRGDIMPETGDVPTGPGGPGGEEIQGGGAGRETSAASRLSSITTREGRQQLRQNRVMKSLFRNPSEHPTENRFHGQADDRGGRETLGKMGDDPIVPPEIQQEAREELARVASQDTVQLDEVREDLSEINRGQGESTDRAAQEGSIRLGGERSHERQGGILGRARDILRRGPKESVITRSLPSIAEGMVVRHKDTGLEYTVSGFEEHREGNITKKIAILVREGRPPLTVVNADLEISLLNPDGSWSTPDPRFQAVPEEDLLFPDNPAGQAERLEDAIDGLNMGRALPGREGEEAQDGPEGGPVHEGGDDDRPPPIEEAEGAVNPERETDSFWVALRDVLNNQEVRDALRDPHLDFRNLEVLNNFMRDWIKSSEQEYGYFLELIARTGRNEAGSRTLRYIENTEAAEQLINGIARSRGRLPLNEFDGSIEISDRARELLFEWGIERMIGIPDYGSEEAAYDIGRSIQLGENQDKMKQLLFSHFQQDNQKFFERMTILIETRPIVHEMLRIINDSEEYQKYMAHLGMSKLDFVRNITAGVGQIYSVYEQSFEARLGLTGGNAFSDEDLATVERDVRGTIEHMQKKGTLVDDRGRPLTLWEMERALKFTKAYHAGTQKSATYVGFGALPPETTSRIGSYPYEYIVRKLHGVKGAAVRYFGAYAHTGWFLTKIFKEAEASEGVNERSRSIYGVVKNVMILNNEFGVFDLIESHGWRSMLTYLGNVDIRVGNTTRTLLEHINESLRRNHSGGLDPVLGLLGKPDSGAISRELSKHLLGQRLFLSMFTRHIPLSTELKGKIWKKRATLSPLTLASIRPEMLSDRQRSLLNSNGGTNQEGLSLRQKIMIAQQARIREDQALYFDQNGEVVAQQLNGDNSLATEAQKYEDLFRIEAIVREKGIGVLSRSERKFYEDCRRSSGPNGEILNLTPDQYRSWIEIDRRVAEAGRARLNEEELRLYESTRATKYRILDYFSETNGNELTSQEELEFVEHVIDSGFIFGDELGKTRISHTLGVDDAPKIALKKRGADARFAGLGQANFIRVIGDQVTLAEASDAFTAHAENPYSEYIEHWTTMVKSWARVLGRPEAQRKLSNIVAAFVEGTIKNKKAALLGPLASGRVPRSKWQEFDITSQLAFDPDERQNLLRTVAQLQLIDPNKTLEVVRKIKIPFINKSIKLFTQHESMLQRLEKRKKAGDKNKAIMNILAWLRVLLPELFVQISKNTVFNKETYQDI